MRTADTAWHCVVLFILLAGPVLAEPADSTAQTDDDARGVVIVGTTPQAGSGIDIDKVPSNVQTISAQEMNRDGQSNLLPTAAALKMTSVSLNDEQGNPFQPDFTYRGFEASPISGVAEGIAVYQSGVRVNEAFGDTVNWDLIPEFAVDRMTVQSDNTVFGLNALGGAVTLDMKNGFNYQGSEAQLSGGSFGNLTGDGEYGARFGNVGVYAGVSGVHDDGFRYHSPTTLRQAFADVGTENDKATLHLSFTGGENDIGGVGPTPVQMLAQNPKSVFTYPQAIHNEMEMVQLKGTYTLMPDLEFSGNTYYRHYRQRLIDGNTTDVEACDNNADFFCLEGNNDYPGDLLYDENGDPVPTRVLPAGATPGETDYSNNNTNTEGVALQTAFTRTFGGHENSLVVGASLDHSNINYGAFGELGSLTSDLAVVNSGVIIDQAYSDTAQPPIEEPVRVNAINDYYGVYLTDTFNLTKTLAWSLNLRYNRAEIGLHDHYGTTLDSNNSFNHVNPGSGFTYKITPNATGYADFAESNRSPTTGELSCADPSRPCLLDSFLVADPPLKQVVGRTYEAGLRGHFMAPGLPGHFQWNLGVYRTENQNDIALLSTAVNGYGYYSNIGSTRRQGIEAATSYHDTRLDLGLNYSLVQATYRDALTISSNSPAADADGNISVQPGDHLPSTPASRVTLQAEYAIFHAWKVGADLRYTGSQYLVGDESNQEPKLPAYTVVNLHSGWQVTRHVKIFGEIDNLFDKTYYTYGTFTQLDGLPPNFSYLSDPRTYSPSPGRVAYAGARLEF